MTWRVCSDTQEWVAWTPREPQARLQQYFVCGFVLRLIAKCFAGERVVRCSRAGGASRARVLLNLSLDTRLSMRVGSERKKVNCVRMRRICGSRRQLPLLTTQQEDFVCWKLKDALQFMKHAQCR